MKNRPIIKYVNRPMSLAKIPRKQAFSLDIACSLNPRQDTDSSYPTYVICVRALRKGVRDVRDSLPRARVRGGGARLVLYSEYELSP